MIPKSIYCTVLNTCPHICIITNCIILLLDVFLRCVDIWYANKETSESRKNSSRLSVCWLLDSMFVHGGSSIQVLQSLLQAYYQLQSLFYNISRINELHQNLYWTFVIICVQVARLLALWSSHIPIVYCFWDRPLYTLPFPSSLYRIAIW